MALVGVVGKRRIMGGGDAPVGSPLFQHKGKARADDFLGRLFAAREIASDNRNNDRVADLPHAIDRVRQRARLEMRGVDPRMMLTSPLQAVCRG